jgi:hypothetical protein
MEDAATLVLELAGLAYGLWLPGILLAWLAGPSWTWSYRLLVGLVLGTLTVPLAAFCAAWILETSVTPAVVIGVATVMNAVTFPILWFRRKSLHVD